MAGGYSNRVRATKYNPTGKHRVQVNLQWAPLPEGGRIKICTRCMKAGLHTGKNKRVTTTRGERSSNRATVTA